MLNAQARGLVNVKAAGTAASNSLPAAPRNPASCESARARFPTPTARARGCLPSQRLQAICARSSRKFLNRPIPDRMPATRKRDSDERDLEYCVCSHDVAASFRIVRHNQRACIVVGCIALARVGHGKDGVLQHPGIVRHGQQVSGIQHRKMVILGRLRMPSSCCVRPRLQDALEARTLEARHVGPRCLRPRCFA